MYSADLALGLWYNGQQPNERNAKGLVLGSRKHHPPAPAPVDDTAAVGGGWALLPFAPVAVAGVGPAVGLPSFFFVHCSLSGGLRDFSVAAAAVVVGVRAANVVARVDEPA